MPENAPTNAVLAEMIIGLSKTMDDHAKTAKESFDKVLAKQDTTNGRIKALELWKALLIGAWTIVTLFIPVFVYLIFHEFDSLSFRIDTKIRNAIEENNSVYFVDDPTSTPNPTITNDSKTKAGR